MGLAAESLPKGACAKLGENAALVAKRLADLARTERIDLEENHILMPTRYLRTMLFALARIGGTGPELLLQFSSDLKSLLAQGSIADSIAAIDAVQDMSHCGVSFAEDLSQLLTHGWAAVRSRAATALGVLGTVGAEYIPSYVIERIADIAASIGEDITTREMATTTLSCFGKFGVHALSRLLRHEDVTARALAARWIGHSKLLLETRDGETIALLVDVATHDADADTRLYAAESLARIGADIGVALLLSHLQPSGCEAEWAAASLAIVRPDLGIMTQCKPNTKRAGTK